MAVPGQIQLTVVRMNDRVPLPRASESNRIRFSAAQDRESDNGQYLNPGHNGGCHRLYKAAVTGREHLPSLWLTAAETLAVRHPAILGPGRAMGRRNGEPAMITVTIWHNVAVDGQGHHSGMLDGYQPGDPMVRVFTYQVDPAGSPEEIAEEAFGICNDHPRDARGEDLARRYYERELRSLSVGDVVAVDEAAFAVGRVGWSLVRGGLDEVCTGEHGTHPLPAPGTTPGGEAAARKTLAGRDVL